MQHILFLNIEYPLEPLCRALRAGGAASTVTESWQEWQHLAKIRPWALHVVAAARQSSLPSRGIHLPNPSYLLLEEASEEPLSQPDFVGVWPSGVTASTVLRAAHCGPLYVSEPTGEVATGNLLLSPVDHVVWWNGKEVDLTPRQFSLLQILASQPGRIFTRVELWEYGWGLTDYPESNAIDAHIRRIRRRVPHDLSACIEAVYGVGYRFLARQGGAVHLLEQKLVVAH